MLAETRMRIRREGIQAAQNAASALVDSDAGLAEIIGQVKVIEHRRQSAVAGKAKKGEEVQLNLRLLTDEEAYRSTFYHEMAHIVCQVISEKSVGHGFLWQKTMILMGRTPRRCHDYDIAKANPNKWKKVDCPICNKSYNISKIRWKKANKGVKYYCPACKTELPIKGAW